MSATDHHPRPTSRLRGTALQKTREERVTVLIPGTAHTIVNRPSNDALGREFEAARGTSNRVRATVELRGGHELEILFSPAVGAVKDGVLHFTGLIPNGGSFAAVRGVFSETRSGKLTVLPN